MPMTGAERVAKHRQRQKDRIAELEQAVSNAQGQSPRLRQTQGVKQLADEVVQLGRENLRLKGQVEDLPSIRFELMRSEQDRLKLIEQVDHLRTYNKRVWTMYKNQRARADSLLTEAEPVEAVDWDTLAGMNPEQLSLWVKAGRKMATKGHDRPAHNAARLVTDTVGVLNGKV